MRCGPDRLEVRARAGAGRSGVRLLGALRVPGPAGRAALEHRGCSTRCWPRWRDWAWSGGRRQRTDSTHVLGRLRDLNRLELAGESVRAALEALAAAAPDWLAGVIDERGQEVLRARIDNLASAAQQHQARGPGGAVRPGRLPPAAAAHDPGAPAWLAGLPAVQALRRIWVQQFYRDVSAAGEKVIRRGRAGPPAGQIPAGLALRHRRALRPKTRQGLDRLQGPPLRDLRGTSDRCHDSPTGRPAGTEPRLITGIRPTTGA